MTEKTTEPTQTATRAFSYFPGCSLDAVGTSYAESTRYIARKIGLEFREIDDWNCCGTSAARITGDDMMYALPARSLALSERQSPDLDVVAPCTGCYASLKQAVTWARASEENRARVSDLIEMDYQASADVKSLLEIMTEPELEQVVIDALEKTLGGMKAACYYGCAQVRPESTTQFDDPENPTRMEKLLDAAGASCIDWSFKTECCGASNHVVAPQTARKATERILRNAAANGAECIVTSCPLCWMNLDMREPQINKEFGTDYHLPVYYFTELLAMALGASAEEAGIGRHFEPAVAYAEGKVGAAPATPVTPSEPAEPATPSEPARTAGQNPEEVAR